MLSVVETSLRLLLRQSLALFVLQRGAPTRRGNPVQACPFSPLLRRFSRLRAELVKHNFGVPPQYFAAEYI
jgi:hypothetical protein